MSAVIHDLTYERAVRALSVREAADKRLEVARSAVERARLELRRRTLHHSLCQEMVSHWLDRASLASVAAEEARDALREAKRSEEPIEAIREGLGES